MNAKVSVRVLATCAVVVSLFSPPIQHASAQDAEREARRAFLDPPNRAAKFQNAEQVFPRRLVCAGEYVWELPRASSPKVFAPSYVWKGETLSSEDFHRRSQTSAMLILKDGQIVSEEYFAGSSAQTRFMSFSAGKSITSTLVGMAVEDGFIKNVDDPLTCYLPALIGSAYEGVSIKDALQMLSGVAFDDDTYDWNDLSLPFSKAKWEATVNHRYRFVEAANALRRKDPVGSKFGYNTMDTALLGWVVENATSKRLATYMQERLWQPAGMEFDAAWLLDGPPEIGREMAGGDFVAALRDYGRFGLLMLNSGRAKGRQLLSADWIRAATSADRPAISFGSLSEGYPLGYGYQWWLFPNGRFTAQGVYGQFIYVAPDANVVIVKLSHWHEPWGDDLESEAYAFFETVIGSLK